MGPQTCKHVLENIHHPHISCMGTMNIEELDLNGGTFKASFPYHWITWLVWVIGLLITLFGFMFALSDTVALIMSSIGLV
ncbi:MAG: hypothetical protein CM15mP71_1530 [Candidatus Poseidoniales archaeon]|nr:MAG: hypothetical protein CM15mP71_1530 [Candidatus Poseidoniales archaeon]